MNKRVLVVLALLLIVLSVQTQAQTVRIAEVNGNIDEGTYSYIDRVLDESEKGNTLLVIFVIDSNSGFIKPTESIINRITSSNVTVAAYSPGGSTGALSASPYIMMSARIAAVAPSSFMGRAQPTPADSGAIESMADYMAKLAVLNNRNPSAARELVKSNLILEGEQALKEGLIDYAPNSVDELVEIASLPEVTVAYESPSVFDMILGVLSSPQVFAFFFLLGGLSGLYALIARYRPADLMVAASYIIVLWSLQNIRLSLLGLALMVLGIMLISLETRHRSPTIFGLMGGIAASIGSITIVAEPFFYTSSLEYLLTLLPTFALVVLSIIIGNRLGIDREEKMHSESEGLVGLRAVVTKELRRNGLVDLGGKIWPAYSIIEEKIEAGAIVEVVKREGKLLNVVREGGPKTIVHVVPEMHFEDFAQIANEAPVGEREAVGDAPEVDEAEYVVTPESTDELAIQGTGVHGEIPDDTDEGGEAKASEQVVDEVITREVDSEVEEPEIKNPKPRKARPKKRQAKKKRRE